MPKNEHIDQSNLGREAVDGIGDVLKEGVLGKSEWKRSKLAYLTGFSSLRSALGSLTSTGRDAAGRFSTLSKTVFREDNSGVAISDEITDSQARFAAAMEANNRSTSDINRSIVTTYRQFLLFAVLFIFAAAWGFGGLIKDGRHGSVMFAFDILFRFSMLPILGALAIRASYTNWMFRRRRLDSLKAYLNSGELWPEEALHMPKGVVKKSVNRGTPPSQTAVLVFLGLCAAILVMLFPDLAFAQSATTSSTVTPSQVFTTTASTTPDLFMRMLAYVIPNVGPVGTPDIGVQPQNTAITSGFTAFSGTLIFLGSAMTGWHILTSLVSSAKEGTALGKNYHEVWAPARVVIGFGMLVPAVQGLCAAQVLVLFLVSWGGNLANLVWQPYIAVVTLTPTNSTTSTSTTNTPAQNAQNVTQAGNATAALNAAKSVFESLLCAEMINLGNTRMNSTDAQITLPPTFSTINNATSGNTTNTTYQLNFGSVCGTLSLVGYTNPTTVDTQNAQNMINVQMTAITTMAGPLDTLAKTAAQTYLPSNGGSGSTSSRYFSDQGQGSTTGATAATTIGQAANGLMTAVSGQVVKQLSSNNPQSSNDLTTLRQQAVTDGWAAAGMYYLTMTRVQGRAYALATMAYQTTGLSVGNTNGLSATISDALVGSSQSPGAIKQFESWWNVNFPTITNSISKTAAKTITDANALPTDPISWISQKIFANGVDAFTTRAASSNVVVNPMAEMIGFGNTLIKFGSGGYAAMAAATISADIWNDSAAGWVSNKTGLGGLGRGISSLLGLIAPLITMILLAMIAAGVVHAYVIPMVPYIMTTFFVAGMLALVVEGLAAAPLWAFFHIRMDGQEFVDQVQKPGYMVAFNLFLRPVLMIFGLMLSNIVFGAMMWFVDYTFSPTASSLASSSGIGLFGTITMIIMVSYIDYQVAMRSFQLINDIPERVSRWFGQGGDHLGDDQHSTKITGAFVGGVEQRATSLGTGISNSQRLSNAGKDPKAPPPPPSGKSPAPPPPPPPPSG